MYRLRFFKPSSTFRNAKNLSTIHPPKETGRPSIFDKVSAFLDSHPGRDPSTFIFKRLKEQHPNGNVPFSEFNSLFDWLAQRNIRRAAKNVFVAMRDAGYASPGSVEARMLVMFMQDWDSEDNTMQCAMAERLVSLVEDKGFTEKDMYGILRLAASQDMDKRVVLFAMDAFRRGKGDIDKYLPALDLLPVAVEAAVRGGSVGEAFAMLEEVGVAFREEMSSRETPVQTARVRPEQSIRRDHGNFHFKSRSAAQQSLRVAYGSLLTSLRDIGAWKTDTHIVGRALRGLEAAGVAPDTTLLNLAMMQAVHTKQYPLALSMYKQMLKEGLAKGQSPDEYTYEVLFTLWEAGLSKRSLHRAFSSVAPRILFRALLTATDPLCIEDIPVSTSTATPTTPINRTTAKPLVLSEPLLMRILRVFLYQKDYAGAYVALSYMTSKTAGITIDSWHAVYYVVVHHLIRRVFAEPPGPLGQARWSEGFLGTSLRSPGPLSDGTRTVTGSVGSKDGPEKPHRPIGSVRLPLNAQTTNYVLEVIARMNWSITDPLYPRHDELPADSTHLFSPLASASKAEPIWGSNSNSNSKSSSNHPTSTNISGRHEFKYSVPSMFMMEHVAPPNLPPGFVWAVEPLQRLLLRALYADAVLDYRRAGRRSRFAARLTHRPLHMQSQGITECKLKVKEKLHKACNNMLPLRKHRSAVPVWSE
ncbi:hypothetical protein D9619_012763 [Psilocybe cf. subviscida]|uniref:Pentacotripeptide-repeat region of PRORP domain-containing protein n=1 Tax=Psilocybe cf. subviscida TaxID=2480587 RepID=A0A8H5EQZ5_9AGAR|nr:hypothetical protein D9619_012763 [Psilocybe cf. subviscida]